MTNFKGSKNFEHGKKISVGVLLCNLGTPDKPTRKAVKRYLAEFLSDPRIVELPRILWLPILHGIILNTRPSRSARAYSKIWTKSGSPLLFHSKNLKTQIERDLDRSWVTFELGMRYGNPSIGSALEALIDKGARQILVVPMYPQYAAATTGSIYDAVFNYCSSLRWVPQIRFTSNDYGTIFAELESDATYLATRIGGSEKLRVDSLGRLLVGTSSSRGVGETTQKLLQIEGVDASTGFSIVRNGANTAPPFLSFGKQRSGAVGGNTIVQQGIERPNELTLDASYGLKLNQSFSMAVAARYIRSDLKLSSDADPTPASSIGIDISGFYIGKTFKISKKDARFRHGFNISNIGPRLKYDEGGQKNFIPTNIKVGSSMDLTMDEVSVLSFNLELNKLLVPSPVATYKDGIFVGYQQPDVSFIKGIFESFADAPGGFSEELKEITWAFGLEYEFQKSFALRTGYFNESLEKGSRRFLTLGAGFSIDFARIDISYLFSTSKIRNPLENTLRFSITLPLSIQNTEIDEINKENSNK